MEYQKFIPEGWYNTKETFTKEKIEDALQTGKIMQGFAYKCDENYNVHINLGDGLTGFIPKNEMDIICDEKCKIPKEGFYKNKINNWVQFKVKKIDENSNIILSRKAVELEARNWMLKELKPGNIVNGIVKNIRPYGVFVEIGGGVVGLIHIEDISISRIKNPNERFFIGQKIKTMIKSIDEQNSKIILTYKELLGNWEDNIQGYEENMVVKGIIKEADKYKNGIFVELTPNLVGLAEYKNGYEYGQDVDVRIKKINKEKKKIKLIIV